MVQTAIKTPTPSHRRCHRLHRDTPHSPQAQPSHRADRQTVRPSSANSTETYAWSSRRPENLRLCHLPTGRQVEGTASSRLSLKYGVKPTRRASSLTLLQDSLCPMELSARRTPPGFSNPAWRNCLPHASEDSPTSVPISSPNSAPTPTASAFTRPRCGNTWDNGARLSLLIDLRIRACTSIAPDSPWNFSKTPTVSLAIPYCAASPRPRTHLGPTRLAARRKPRITHPEPPPWSRQSKNLKPVQRTPPRYSP